MSAPSCGTCAHYSGEGCAIRVKTPMQHKLCPPTWACPAWQEGEADVEPYHALQEKVERERLAGCSHGIACVCVTCEQERLAALVEQYRRKQHVIEGLR